MSAHNDVLSSMTTRRSEASFAPPFGASVRRAALQPAGFGAFQRLDGAPFVKQLAALDRAGGRARHCPHPSDGYPKEQLTSDRSDKAVGI